jgi:hypothetical protein
MKSLKRRIRDWLNDDDDDSMVMASARTHDGSHLDSQGFRLQVYKASGGIVIETHAYDEKKDRSNIGLYVITEDQDVGHELGKIITFENLKL